MSIEVSRGEYSFDTDDAEPKESSIPPDSEEEGEDEPHVKMEVESPRMGRRERRKKVIKRVVERPKTVYERFPTFEKDRVLDFTELFKGYTVHKSRLSKRPLASMSHKVHAVRRF